jgi:hypothetical protein
MIGRSGERATGHRADGRRVKLSLHARVKRAGLYALTVALSFWVCSALSLLRLYHSCTLAPSPHCSIAHRSHALQAFRFQHLSRIAPRISLSSHIYRFPTPTCKTSLASCFVYACDILQPLLLLPRLASSPGPGLPTHPSHCWPLAADARAQLMLVAMTYNTYLFSSIVLGSFLGHVMYEGEIDLG